MCAATPKTWPLRCPECGQLAFVELPLRREVGHTGTAACPRGHGFIFQDNGAGVDVVGGRHVRGRHQRRDE